MENSPEKYYKNGIGERRMNVVPGHVLNMNLHDRFGRNEASEKDEKIGLLYYIDTSVFAASNSV